MSGFMLKTSFGNEGLFRKICEMNYFSLTLAGVLFLSALRMNVHAQVNCTNLQNYAIVEIPNADVGNIQMFYKDQSGNRFWNIWNVKKHVEKQGKQLVFAMNGGMYTPLYKPVGLYIDQGKELQSINLKNGDNNFCWKPNGVFAIDNNGKAQVTVSEKFNSSNIRFATQSGPMILINGKMHDGFEKSTSTYIRNAVGVKSNGDVFFCISLKAVTFQQLAEFMLKNNCVNALYFDGSVSEMYCPQNNQWDCGSSFGVIVGYVK
jgi:prepilin-type processing-associated H-X9-DG protein